MPNPERTRCKGATPNNEPEQDSVCQEAMHISSSQRSITNADGNKPVVALYERATKALPRLPLFIRSLSDAPLFISIERITAELGYDLI